jgi:hypothetical protein
VYEKLFEELEILIILFYSVFIRRVYMKLHKILSLILVAALAITVGLVGCSPQPGGDSGGGAGGGGEAVDKITIIFNFEGTYLPEDYSVIPFVVGSLGSINSNKYYNWDAVINGGIKKDGTGSHVLTKISSREYKFEILTSDILLDPDTPTSVEFKAANYNTNGWDDVTNDFWGTIGNQLTGLDNEKIVISNNQIIEAYKPGSTDPVLPGQSTNGIELSADGKTIKIYVGQHGGWSVHIAYNVTSVNLTLVVSNVATNKGGDALGAYGYSGTFNSWGGPEPATILSTNADGTVNIIGTFTYSGSGKVEYKVRGSNIVTGNWEWASGANKLAIIPYTASGSSYTNYEPGSISF